MSRARPGPSGGLAPIGDEATVDRIAVLMKQYELITSDIRDLMATNDRLMYVGFTILGAGYAFGMKEKLSEVVAVLPFIAISILYYTLFIYTNVMTLGGHKRFIEEQINLKLGQNTLFWERLVAAILQGNTPSIFLSFIYLGFTLVACAFGDSALTMVYGTDSYNRYYRLAIGFFLLGLLLSFLKMVRAYSRSYKLSWRIASERVELSEEVDIWRNLSRRVRSVMRRRTSQSERK